MISESSRKLEEDEMLRYAHVERSVKKHYAFRYKGRLDHVPHFFLADIASRKVRGYEDEITFYPEGHIRKGDLLIQVEAGSDNRPDQICRDGDWIVIDGNTTKIMSDQDFRDKYQPVADLNY